MKKNGLRDFLNKNWPLLNFVIVGVCLWISTIIHIQPEWQFAVIDRWGNDKPIVRNKPGLFIHYPWPIDHVQMRDKRINILNQPEFKSIILSDKSLFQIKWIVFWNIMEPEKAIQKWPKITNQIIQNWLDTEIYHLIQSTFSKMPAAEFSKVLRAESEDSKKLFTELQNQAKSHGLGVSYFAVIPYLGIDAMNNIQMSMNKSKELEMSAQLENFKIKLAQYQAETDRLVKTAKEQLAQKTQLALSETQSKIDDLERKMIDKNPELFNLLRRQEVFEKTLRQSGLPIEVTTAFKLSVQSQPAPMSASAVQPDKPNVVTPNPTHLEIAK